MCIILHKQNNGNFMEAYQRLNSKYYSISHLQQDKRFWCSANVENSVTLMLLHKYFFQQKHYLGISQGVPIKELQYCIILPVGINIMCLPPGTINFKLKQQAERLQTVLLKNCLLSSSQLEHLLFSSSENFRTLHSNNIVSFCISVFLKGGTSYKACCTKMIRHQTMFEVLEQKTF